MKPRSPRAATGPGISPATLGWAVLTVGLCALSGCGQAQSSAVTPETPLDIQWQAIEAINSGDVACDTDSQCRTLPVGSKACGGPERWLVWSTKGNREAMLRNQIDRVASTSVGAPGWRGGYSDCAVLPDPGAACRAGRCELQQGPAAAR